jgi:hypothetical protein
MTRRPKKQAQKPKTRIITGDWGECESCGQWLPLHPDIGLCGCCAFGEADALLEFMEPWEETT